MIVGDIVTRNMCGIKTQLKITEITADKIVCGDWEFDKNTGAEIDEELGWNNERTGSYLEL